MIRRTMPSGFSRRMPNSHTRLSSLTLVFLPPASEHYSSVSGCPTSAVQLLNRRPHVEPFLQVAKYIPIFTIRDLTLLFASCSYRKVRSCNSVMSQLPSVAGNELRFCVDVVL